MKRRLLLFCCLVAASVPSACLAEPPHGETAWLCHSRIGGWLPRLGILHHSSVAICPCGELPVVRGRWGWVNNPRCAFCGTTPGECTFMPEEHRYGVTYEPVPLPAEEVKERVTGFHRLWRWRYNCQHAAAEVTGKSCPCDCQLHH